MKQKKKKKKEKKKKKKASTTKGKYNKGMSQSLNKNYFFTTIAIEFFPIYFTS